MAVTNVYDHPFMGKSKDNIRKSIKNLENHWKSNNKSSKNWKQQSAAFGGTPRGRALRARPLGNLLISMFAWFFAWFQMIFQWFSLISLCFPVIFPWMVKTFVSALSFGCFCSCLFTLSAVVGGFVAVLYNANRNTIMRTAENIGTS